MPKADHEQRLNPNTEKIKSHSKRYHMMNSLERVLLTLRHEEPDRVPVGEWGIDHDHVSKILGRHTYWRNRKDCTLAFWEGRRDEVVASEIGDYTDLIKKLDHDLLPVHLVAPKNYKVSDPPKKTGDGIWRDSQGVEYIYAASNDSIVAVTEPAPGKEQLEDADIQAWKNGVMDIDEAQFELVDAILGAFGSEKAVVFRDISVFSPLLEPFGGNQEHRLIIPVVAPEEVLKMHDPVFEYNKKLIDLLHDRGVRFLMAGNDLGDNKSCIYPPNTLRKIFFPLLKRVVQYARLKDMHFFFHCCGNVWEVLDDFVDAGMEAYQSIQFSAGMDWKKVKELYGARLTLWAGIQCETLVQGSEKEVENEVRKYLDILMPGGGFIFGSTNSVQFGAKTGNYLQALELVRKHGIYR